MLLNSENRMITQRHDPRLALIKIRLRGDGKAIILTAPLMEELVVAPKQSTCPDDVINKFTVWSTPTEGVEVSESCSQWFSRFLGQKATLVQHMPSFKKRPVTVESKRGAVDDYRLEIQYQDGSPVHMINETSIAEANNLLPADDEAKFEVRNFRPNIVITGAPPHDEEKWLYVRINEIVCKNVKLCTRCTIPTIDQDRGVKVSSKTGVLRAFRSPVDEYERKNYDADPLFGNNLVPESSGTFAVGMTFDAAFK